ncbi:hypothetical protein U1Q18_029010 [Sarracenia purpurea var. burkii]
MAQVQARHDAGVGVVLHRVLLRCRRCSGLVGGDEEVDGAGVNGTPSDARDVEIVEGEVEVVDIAVEGIARVGDEGVGEEGGIEWRN